MLSPVHSRRSGDVDVVVVGLLLCVAAVSWDRRRALKAAGRELEERTRALVHDREELAAANGRAHRLAAVVRSSDDAIFAKTLTGTILEWNPAAEGIYGWSAAEIVGRPVSVLVPPDRTGELADIVERIGWGERLAPFETVRVRKDGQRIDVAVTVSPVLDLTGEVVGASTISRDITVQKRAERALRQSEERFRLSFENASIGMALVAPDGRFLRVNRALCNIVGMSEWVLLNTTFQAITHPDDLEADLELVRQMLAGEIRTYTMEKRYVHARRHVVWVNLSVSLARDNDGRPLHFISQITDITARREAERSREEAVAALAHAAVHDALTGLPNRVLLGDRLEQALMRSGRSGSPVAVLFLDLDRFKLINDSLGHAAGDQVLVTAAERLKATIRSGDAVARFGGDEFVVVAEQHVGGLPAAALAERLNAVLSEPFTVDGSEVFLSASIGIAFGRGAEATAEGLLRDADAAMYRAKEGGRARVEFFDEPMRTEAAGRLELQNALHRALDRGELRLLYQPIVDLGSSRLVGVEALLRWRHPDLGLLGPSSFIPLAEEAGLIVPIGEWLIGEAARMCARWQPHDQREPVGPPAPPARPARRGGDGGAEGCPARRRPPARAHRERPHGGPRAPRADAGRPAGPRRVARHRRLRDGLLVARLPAPVSRPHGEDRPELRGRAGPQPGRLRHRRQRDQAGPRPRPRGGGRGDRDPGAGRLPPGPRMRQGPGVPLRRAGAGRGDRCAARLRPARSRGGDGGRDYCTIMAVTMPNIPSSRSAWGRTWQCQAHTPGSAAVTRTV